jgi:putative Mn2+ efflux pump MntP
MLLPSLFQTACSHKVTKKNALITGISFGLFQAFMPVLGYFLGKTFFDLVYRYQHWIAFFLLNAIGFNMLVEAIREHKATENPLHNRYIFTIKNLAIQGIATSIDALAAGVSFAVLKINIFIASLLIGIITFYCCFFGVCIGRVFGSLLGLRARLIGGIILIVTGIKIFLEHQFT